MKRILTLNLGILNKLEFYNTLDTYIALYNSDYRTPKSTWTTGRFSTGLVHAYLVNNLNYSMAEANYFTHSIHNYISWSHPLYSLYTIPIKINLTSFYKNSEITLIPFKSR